MALCVLLCDYRLLGLLWGRPQSFHLCNEPAGRALCPAAALGPGRLGGSLGAPGALQHPREARRGRTSASRAPCVSLSPVHVGAGSESEFGRRCSRSPCPAAPALSRGPAAVQPGPRAPPSRRSAPAPSPSLAGWLSRPPLPRAGVGWARGGLHSCGWGGIRAASPVSSRASCSRAPASLPARACRDGLGPGPGPGLSAAEPASPLPTSGAPGREAALGSGWVARGSLPGVRGVLGEGGPQGARLPRVGSVARPLSSAPRLAGPC